jgi:hypothetical protein
MARKDGGASLSLEALLTSPAAFGLTTATPVQRAKCRIVSGVPLGPLADRDDVQKMLGGGTPPDRPPLEVLDISASRVGKSLFAAALVVWLSQNVDVSQVAIGDIVRIPVVALKLDGTRAIMTHLLNHLLAKPALRALMVDDPNEVSTKQINLRHPSGRVIEVLPVPLDRAGGSALSVYCAGCVVDEFPRMIGAEDGVRNVEHFRDGVLGRFLPNAVYLSTGSPWQPFGPAYDAVVEHFGEPTRDLVVLRTTGPAANPSWWTSERCEDLQRRNPLAYKTDCLAEFADGEQSVFPAQAIEDAWSRPAESDVEYGRPAIFADPSALRHDFWAAMVGGWVHPIATQEDLFEVEQLGDIITPGRGAVMPGRNGWIRVLEDAYGNPIPKRDGLVRRPWFEVYEIKSWDKKSGARGLDLVQAVGELARQYDCTEFHWDGYEQLMLGDLIRRQGLRPMIHTWSGANRKTEAVDHLRTLFVERRVRLVQHDLLKQELVRFRARATPGGNFQYIVAGGAGHGDHASCLTLAMRADLDGFVDRSPTMRAGQRHEIFDYEEPKSALD